MTAQTSERPRVFVSYSHNDREWLERLRVHLKPLRGQIDLWDDTRIKPGAVWYEEIKRGLEGARAALLLVSADFLASDPSVAAATPGVYIHISDEGQRARAREVAQALKVAGCIVPGVELRPERVRDNQVRYFRPEEKEVADKVSGILGEQRVAGARPSPVGGFKVPPGQIEVRFAPRAAGASP